MLFIEDLDGLLPSCTLGIVDLAQVEDVTLHHCAPDAAALDDRPGAMLFAVLLSDAALEKHGASVAGERPEGRGWVATTRRFGASSVGIFRKTPRPVHEKSQMMGPVAEVGLAFPHDAAKPVNSQIIRLLRPTTKVYWRGYEHQLRFFDLRWG